MHPCGLHLIIGKKGAGKSMLATKMMTRILGETKRQIITNLPLNIPQLREYMAEHWPSSTIDNRITIITEAKLLKRFWLSYGQDWWIPDVTKEAYALGERLDYRMAYRWLPTTESTRHRMPITDMTKAELYSYAGHGPLARDRIEIEMCPVPELPACQFIIDELQNIFPARGFMQTSQGCLYWLSQQRHLGADFIGLTQNADLIDKEFRDLADDYLFITNWGRKQKSLFRLPKMMTWSKYDQKPGPGIKPMVSGFFSLDISGIGQCYDTSAGVGIEGNLDADTKEKTPGIHWAWFVLVFAALLYGLTYIPGLMKGFFHRLLFSAPTIATAAASTNTLSSIQLSTLSTNPTKTIPAPTTAAPLVTLRTNLVACVFLKGEWKFSFADGSSLSTEERIPGLNIVPIVRKGKCIGVYCNGTNWLLP